jgi:hypothetical protein
VKKKPIKILKKLTELTPKKKLEKNRVKPAKTEPNLKKLSQPGLNRFLS